MEYIWFDTRLCFPNRDVSISPEGIAARVMTGVSRITTFEAISDFGESCRNSPVHLRIAS